jgi:HlyD family secretion protein
MATKRSIHWAKWIWTVIALGVLAAGGAWYFKRDSSNTPQYQTVPVARGSIVQTVTATGQLNPVLQVQVGSQISGIIQELHADFNSPVKAGQVIAQLDPATYKANVSQSEGELANAQASLELTRINARRAEELFSNNLISQSDYERAMVDLQQAEAQVKIRQGSLERARVDLARCTIYAPVDGVVISRDVDVGQTVAASLQAPTLFVIANDLTKMQINTSVSEADIGTVDVGQNVEFTVDAFPYRTFQGKVVQVRNAPITVQNVVTYDTIIEVSNPDMKLKPGMTANVSVIIAQRDNALRIPNAALRFRPPDAPVVERATNVPQAAAQQARPDAGRSLGGAGGGRGGRGSGGAQGGAAGRARMDRPAAPRTVYVLAGSGEKPEPQPVQIRTGISDGVTSEVLDGLSEGDRIITGMISSEPAGGARPPGQPNPFGGGGSFRRL